MVSDKCSLRKMVVHLAALLTLLQATEELQQEPARVHAPDPEYPADARRQEQQADVVVDCTVDPSGRVVSVQVLTSQACSGRRGGGGQELAVRAVSPLTPFSVRMRPPAELPS